MTRLDAKCPCVQVISQVCHVAKPYSVAKSSRVSHPWSRANLDPAVHRKHGNNSVLLS